jgi:hypothetical protein
MNRMLMWAGLGLVAMVWPLFANGTSAPKAAPGCAGGDIAADVNGDGHADCVRLTRVGQDAWVDVRTTDGQLRSTTRVGQWTADTELEAFNADGDARMDLVRRWQTNGTHWAQVWLSDGAAYQASWSGEDPRVTTRTLVAR